MKGRSGGGGSNPLCSTLQSPRVHTSRRIARNPRVCARFTITHGPGEGLRWRESGRFGKIYPPAILLGPSVTPWDRGNLPSRRGRARYFVGWISTVERELAHAEHLLLRAPEQGEIDPTRETDHGEVQWLVACGDRLYDSR